MGREILYTTPSWKQFQRLVLELVQKLLYTTPSWWWWCIKSLFRVLLEGWGGRRIGREQALQQALRVWRDPGPGQIQRAGPRFGRRLNGYLA